MANRGDSNRLETPRRIRRMLALMIPTADAHQLGVVRRLFQQAASHAQSVDRYILPGHGYHDPGAVSEETEVAQAANAAAAAARHVRNDLEAVRLRKAQPLKED